MDRCPDSTETLDLLDTRLDVEQLLNIAESQELIVTNVAVNSVENAVKMDAAYFNDEAKVKADLESYSLISGLICPQELYCGRNILRNLIKCHNGETIKFRSYLNRAAIAMGFAKNKVEAQAKMRFTLDYLLKKFFNKEIIPVMDAAYFNDEAKVKADLESYALISGVFTPIKLVCNNASLSIGVKCQNQEVVLFEAYLNRAAIAMGFAKNKVEAKAKMRFTLDYLLKKFFNKEIIPVMDEAYFNDDENIKEDLNLFVAKFGLVEAQALNCSKDKFSVSVTCRNGEIVSFRTYLCRVGIYLGMGSEFNDLETKLSKVLDYLLINYFKKPDSFEMDKAYLENISNLRYDLISYANVLKVYDPHKITCIRENLFCRTICKNGENKLFKTYLLNAEKKLGIASETQSKLSKILKYLLQKAFPTNSAKLNFSDSVDGKNEERELLSRRESLSKLGISQKALKTFESKQPTLLQVETVRRKINELLFRGFKNPLGMIDYLPILMGYSLDKIDHRIEVLRRYVYEHELDIDPIAELEARPNWLSFSPQRFGFIMDIAIDKAADKSEINGKRISTMFNYNFECLVLAAANNKNSGLREVVREAGELNKEDLSFSEKRERIRALPNRNIYKKKYFKIYAEVA